MATNPSTTYLYHNNGAMTIGISQNLKRFFDVTLLIWKCSSPPIWLQNSTQPRKILPSIGHKICYGRSIFWFSTYEGQPSCAFWESYKYWWKSIFKRNKLCRIGCLQVCDINFLPAKVLTTNQREKMEAKNPFWQLQILYFSQILKQGKGVQNLPSWYSPRQENSISYFLSVKTTWSRVQSEILSQAFCNFWRELWSDTCGICRERVPERTSVHQISKVSKRYL